MAHRNIIVIGASAGGVEALQTLAAQLPAQLPATVFVVLHISPTDRSLLPEILSQAGALPAAAARDGEEFRSRHIYVAVPDRHLIVEKHTMRITKGPRENRVRPSVDVLFRAAAVNHGPRVVGIVLTGALEDGTAGLWTIKDRGGVAIVQSPEEARYASMPASALQQVKVDHVARVKDMGALIQRLIEEEIPMAQEKPVHEGLLIEERIATQGDAFEAGAMKLGPASLLTCPECRGAMVKVEDGSPVTRFRCHAGHAYTLRSLLADLDQSLDHSLWNVVRGIEERLIILGDLEQEAKARGDHDGRERYRREISLAQERHRELRELVLGTPDLTNSAPARSKR